MKPENTPQDRSCEPFLSIDEAAAFVGRSVSTLNAYRAHGRGPEYRSVDGRICYFQSDLEAWMNETDGLLDTAAAAAMTGLSVRHMENLRSYGTGPAFMKLRGQRGAQRVFYRPDDVIAWRDAR